MEVTISEIKRVLFGNASLRRASGQGEARHIPRRAHARRLHILVELSLLSVAELELLVVEVTLVKLRQKF
jgi:hypothetical protein